MKPSHAWHVAWTRPTATPSAAWWVAVSVYAGAIFLASSTAHPMGIQRLPPGVDKMIHAVLFGGLCATVWMALRSSAPDISTTRLALLAITLTTVYGLTDEIHQSFVPGRTMEMLDLAADAGGACLVQGALWHRQRSRGPTAGSQAS